MMLLAILATIFSKVLYFHTMYDFKIISVFCNPKKGLLGNTAAVVLLDEVISAERMQLLASDLNQPATSFLWPYGSDHKYYVRWFAPDAEIGLCGHGTLAALAFLGHQKGRVQLHYPEGIITGTCMDASAAAMQLAGIPVIKPLEVPDTLTAGLGLSIAGYYQTSDKNIVWVKDEDALRNMKPDFMRLRQIDTFGYAVTAPGKDVDFVSRTLVPHVQQLEDHATGSSHAALTLFWSKRLQKTELTALQLSPRGGAFECKLISGGTDVQLTGEFRVIARGSVNF